MKIKVRFFARYRELVGKDKIEMEVEEGATVASLKKRLEKEFPELGGIDLVAINNEYVEPEYRLREGDEVALLPPLSGG